MTTTLTPKLVGARVKRVEDRRLLTGQGRYVDDHRPAGTLYAAFLRSPHAHARIVHVDAAPALAAPGVVAVLTGEEIARLAKPLRAASKMPHYKETAMPALAVGKVRYVGEPVAVVVAESRYAAEDALDRIAVRYETLPPVTDMEAALANGSPLVHDDVGTNLILRREFAVGDVDAALRGAEVVVRERFRFYRHAGVCMENRGCLAEYDAGAERLSLHSSTQCPNILRDCLADLLDLPEHSVRVVAPDVGGGFGVKTPLYQEETTACVLARRLRRPIKWVEDRREDLLTTIHAWDEILDVELGLKRDGTFVGLRAEVYVDVGAYSIFPWTAAIEPVQCISFLPGPYVIPNYRGRTHGIATNKCPMGPYRGVARPVSTFAMEGMVDRAARRMGMDPTELRIKNYIREFPYKSPSGVVWDSGSFTESMLKAKETLDYGALRAEQERLRAQGRYVGIGIASYVELTGVGSAIPVAPGMAITTGMEAATVRVDPSGKVTALFGIASHGQGLETTLAQVVAGELGVPFEDVKVLHGDTAVSPYGTGTYASRSAVIGGGAGILAGRAVREKALAIAAHMLEANVEDLDLRDGKIYVKGVPQPALTLRDVAKSAYYGVKHIPRDMEPGLESTRFYDPYFGTTSNATHAAVVEVDPETGRVEIRKFVVIEDCGVVINPMVVEGQAHGGVAQGIGAALLEELVYDGEGQLLTGTLMDYVIPSASEIPSIEVVHLETPSPTALGGFKGMGEGGTIGAPGALANAVADALAPFAVEITEMPMTPERILRLVQAARQRRRDGM
jgi:carbon-monoxide dehydrogenase large subunit